MVQRGTRDTVLICGWLFSDLLLGLMMIFLVSMQPPPPPKLFVQPQNLDQKNHQNCTGGPHIFRCIVTLQAAAQALGQVNWRVSDDIGKAVTFSPSNGTLSPGASVKVTIAAIPCQNGTFTFSGQTGVFPATVGWQCTPPPLSLKPLNFTLTFTDRNALIQETPAAVQEIENKIINQWGLQGQQAGLVIVFGGARNQADTDNAKSVAKAIYDILIEMGNQGFTPLTGVQTLAPFHQIDGGDQNITNEAFVDVFLFRQ